MKEQLLQLLLQAFDERIETEKEIRGECEHDSTHWHHAFGRVDGVDTGRFIVEKVFLEHAELAELIENAHKRNTALTVELNEFCQQQGIGKIGDSIVPAIKTYIKNIQTSLDLTERLIISEIGDFTAGLGNLGEPQTPEQIHEQLMVRMQRVFVDLKVHESPTEEVNTKTAVFDVVTERRRQQVEEGYGHENDDLYIKGELAAAAACYADRRIAGYIWPWSSVWYKPNFNRQDLVKAAALMIAEIERIDRLNAKAGAK